MQGYGIRFEKIVMDTASGSVEDVTPIVLAMCREIVAMHQFNCNRGKSEQMKKHCQCVLCLSAKGFLSA